ncbi:MAG TPA: dihydrodipicolinate synthase family protein [Burkholderiales bacterium]|jgi:dihydrodipicolinate synthase/N-acetylneuraminate lyase|nr:dihydrodipicolinate synthase family protein [Burkholderiales bacterium]
MKLEFKGVFPAPPTPITDDGRIHEKALRALLDDNISHGCGGFWMAGSTGEGPVLTDEQRDVVARISAETCKGRALVIMQVGAMTTASAVKAAKTTRATGCAAVCCLPPLFFRTNERSIIDYYKAVADAAGDLPFFVYNLPQLTQVEFLPPLMEKLKREIPTLKGLKHSAPDFSQIRVFTDMGLTCFSGNGAFPLPALTMGAVGTIDAPPSLAPWHYSELFSAWEAGNIARAKTLQDGVRKYVDLVWMFGAPADVCKTVLSARLGVDCGRSIPPVNRLTDDQRREVLRAAEALGVTETGSRDEGLGARGRAGARG